MGDRFWVGDGGSVSSIVHWSATDGGAGGESVPGNTDDVFFTANSFSISGQTVSGDLTCKSVDWTGVTDAPYFNGNITTKGDVMFISDMTTNPTKYIYWDNIPALATVNFTAPDKTFSQLTVNTISSGVVFNILSDITVTGIIEFDCNTGGAIYTNDYTINCGNVSRGSNYPTLYLGSSVINADGWGWTSNVNAGTSKIILNSYDSSFSVGAYPNTYYDLEIVGDNTCDIICYDTSFNSVKVVGSNSKETVLTLSGFTCDDIQMYGNLSYNLLIKNYLGATTYKITTMQDIELTYCDITYMEKVGTGSITAYSSIDSGNNIDVDIFTTPKPGFNIFLGESQIINIYKGTEEITSAYLGTSTLK
jgi:hypothetical protein